MFLKGRARRGPTFGETLLVHAVARLALHPLITNIQVSWVKIGPEGVRQALAAGVNDLGGTLMNESISRAAGSEWGQELPPEQMEAVIRSAGRVPRQRTTTYGTPPEEQVRALVRRRAARRAAQPAGARRGPEAAGAARAARTRRRERLGSGASFGAGGHGFLRIRNGSDSGPADGRQSRARERLLAARSSPPARGRPRRGRRAGAPARRRAACVAASASGTGGRRAGRRRSGRTGSCRAPRRRRASAAPATRARPPASASTA